MKSLIVNSKVRVHAFELNVECAKFIIFLISTAVDPRSCGDLTCDPNAECFNPSPGHSECNCRPGYVGEGEIGPNGEPGCEGKPC